MSVFLDVISFTLARKTVVLEEFTTSLFRVLHISLVSTICGLLKTAVVSISGTMIDLVSLLKLARNFIYHQV
jgi:hypothetical protein